MSTADTYFDNLSSWKEELMALRKILSTTDLKETIKWNQPCYTINDKNVVILGGFKEFCVISFFKGILIKDDANILVQQGANTRTAKIIPFKSLEEITTIEHVIKKYITEAIEIENKGSNVKPASKTNLKFPHELVDLFALDSDFKKAFYKLTPGRQRGYLIYIDSAKQSKTKIARAKKYTERIMNGFGIHDCTCGKSKRMPNCDGTHKYEINKL